MPALLEVFMVTCFGLSWPISIYKSYKARTAKGKSLLFEIFIWLGYIFGMLSKVMSGTFTYVLFFYILNFLTVSIDMVIYIRNVRLDKLASRNKSN